MTNVKIPKLTSLLVLSAISIVLTSARADDPSRGFDPRTPADRHPGVPMTWDEQKLSTHEIPLARANFSPRHVPAHYYYRLRIRPIYKAYPIFDPRSGKEPVGYLEWLKNQEPVVLWDSTTAPPLKADSDWEVAGREVFQSTLEELPIDDVRNPEWYKATNMPQTKSGIMPFLRYVVTKKGEVKVGSFSCAMCHTRVLADGNVIEGAQGNFPAAQVIAWTDSTTFNQAHRKIDKRDAWKEFRLNQERQKLLRGLYGAPWLGTQDPFQLYNRFEQDCADIEPMLAYLNSIPPGVQFRSGTSVLSPVQVPDLIGIKDRRYLDRTGLVLHRDIGDLMRYAALNQGGSALSSYGGFVPGDIDANQNLPNDPEELPGDLNTRYSDVQLYALARFIYSLKSPDPNPRRTPEAVDVVNWGRRIFETQNCARCHTPPTYTNNRLTPAEGYRVPADHPQRIDLSTTCVGTDSTLTLNTRRGTGFYKVPSLKGVWYRGPFEHNGSCATLEDWFDPLRRTKDYSPTGWKGPPGTRERAVPGHPYGLDLSEDERNALIAFLRTL